MSKALGHSEGENRSQGLTYHPGISFADEAGHTQVVSQIKTLVLRKGKWQH